MIEINNIDCTSMSTISGSIMQAIPQIMSETSQIGVLILCAKNPNLNDCTSKFGVGDYSAESLKGGSKYFLKQTCVDSFKQIFEDRQKEMIQALKLENNTQYLLELEKSHQQFLTLPLEEKKLVNKLKQQLKQPLKIKQGYLKSISNGLSTILEMPRNGIDLLSNYATVRQGLSNAISISQRLSDYTNIIFAGAAIALGAMGTRRDEIIGPVVINAIPERLFLAADITKNLLKNSAAQLFRHPVRNLAILTASNGVVKVLDSVETSIINEPIKADVNLVNIAINEYHLENFKQELDKCN